MVFAIALTPFAVFHNHHVDEVKCSNRQAKCHHQFHIHTQKDNCLVCAAHFEKSYTRTEAQYNLYRFCKQILNPYTAISGSYAELISQALRGPPVV